MTIAEPSNESPEPDIFGLRFNALEKSAVVDISGSIFYEGEETVS